MADRETNALARDPERLYFEDYTPGRALAGGRYLVSEEEILEFGRRFDPQPIHSDPEAAAASAFGGLIAPGCLTFAIRNALCNQLPVRPVLIAGLGLDDLRLENPVRPGDTLRLEVTVEQARRSKSKPGQGIVVARQRVLNQRDEIVLSMVSKMMVEARDAN